MSSDAIAILDRLDLAQRELAAASQAAIQLARTLAKQQEAALADDDDWRRMPGAKARCPISGWSRSSLNRLISSTDPKRQVRRKRIDGSVYYSGADVRRLLNSSPE